MFDSFSTISLNNIIMSDNQINYEDLNNLMGQSLKKQFNGSLEK